MEHEQQNCCCETKGLIKEVKSELALQLERCCCDLKKQAAQGDAHAHGEEDQAGDEVIGLRPAAGQCVTFPLVKPLVG